MLLVNVQLPSLEKRKKKRSTYNSESLVRGVRFLRYCLVCSASLFRAMVRLADTSGSHLCWHWLHTSGHIVNAADGLIESTA